VWFIGLVGILILQLQEEQYSFALSAREISHEKKLELSFCEKYEERGKKKKIPTFPPTTLHTPSPPSSTSWSSDAPVEPSRDSSSGGF
jgi:hypothetical protein